MSERTERSAGRERTIRVLIADDHPVFRHGLRTALSGVAGIDVVGEAVDGVQAVALAVERNVDVVLMDLQMPGMAGLDAISELARSAPSVAVLVLSMFDNDESLFTAMRAGARGYLVKGADEEQIVRAIRVIAGGDVVFGNGAGARALAYFAAAPASSRAARPFPELTDREFEVLGQIAAGASNAEIARRLFLSDKTVRNYVASVIAKLQAEDRAQAAIRAVRAGL
jgi:DNA-binding NarL/FixJ family response regulator